MRGIHDRVCSIQDVYSVRHVRKALLGGVLSFSHYRSIILVVKICIRETKSRKNQEQKAADADHNSACSDRCFAESAVLLPCAARAEVQVPGISPPHSLSFRSSSHPLSITSPHTPSTSSATPPSTSHSPTPPPPVPYPPTAYSPAPPCYACPP